MYFQNFSVLVQNKMPRGVYMYDKNWFFSQTKRDWPCYHMIFICACFDEIIKCVAMGRVQFMFCTGFITWAQPSLAPVIKCRWFLSFFQCCIVRDVSLAIAGSLLLRVLAGSLKFKKHEAWRTVKRIVIAFWGTRCSPTLTMHYSYV